MKLEISIRDYKNASLMLKKPVFILNIFGYLFKHPMVKNYYSCCYVQLASLKFLLFYFEKLSG